MIFCLCQGKFDLAVLVVDHAKDRFPNLSCWQLAEQVVYFTRNLFQGKWQAAQEAVIQLATLDKWESLLRLVVSGKYLTLVRLMLKISTVMKKYFNSINDLKNYK